MQDYLSQFQKIRDYTEMYIMKESYISVVAYLEGYDFAMNGEVFKHFKEWLVVRCDGANNLRWPSLVLDQLSLGIGDPLEIIASSAELERSAIDKLFELFFEFDAEKKQLGGVNEIFTKYEMWLKKNPMN